MIKSGDIARVLVSMVEDDGRKPDKVAEDFFLFAEKYNLKSLIKSVLFRIESLREKDEEKNKIAITLASKGDEKFLGDIKKTIRAEGGEAEVVIDEEILGGFTAKYKNRLHDYSLLSQVNKLRNKLKQA